jgi:D-proline reductase (dithiol) PrdB
MGCAKDIVEQAGVPRYVWSDFPLGNSAGKPNDKESQRLTLELALEAFDTITQPRTTLTSPQKWSDSSGWQLDFMNIEIMSAARIGQLKTEFLDQKRIANELKKR